MNATGADGDQFYIALTSSSNYLITVSSTMTIGPATGTFSVITKLQALGLSGPANLDFGMWNASESQQIIEKTLTGASDYFRITDYA